MKKKKEDQVKKEKNRKILMIFAIVLLVAGFFVTILLGNGENSIYSFIGIMIMVTGIIFLFVNKLLLYKRK
jgi:uncharacterized membrane protein HdeD (DUF308 family)